MATTPLLFEDLQKSEAFEAFHQALDFALKNGTVSEEMYALAQQEQYSPKACIMSAYVAKKGADSGYTQVRFHGKKYDLHRLACALRCGPGGINDEASHLCPDQLSVDRRGCFNPAHLHWEAGLINKSRLCCLLFKDTHGYFCPHNPPCLISNTLFKPID
jgi:hypothetical protein